jgi:hypothetical protein
VISADANGELSMTSETRPTGPAANVWFGTLARFEIDFWFVKQIFESLKPSRKGQRTVPFPKRENKRQNTFEKYSKLEARDFSLGEILLLNALTKAITELRTGTGKPAKEDPLKVLILCALRSAHQGGHNGLNSLELMELFLGRELTEDEEEYVIVADTPAGHA